MKPLKGVIILAIIIALWLTIYRSDPAVTPMISGVVDESDSNHPVEVYFGSAKFQNLEDMTKDLGIKIYPEDKTEIFPDPALGIGSRIEIQRALPIEVTDAKATKTYRTWQKTVGDLLLENNLELLGQDSVEPSISTWLQQNTKVKITRVAEVEVTEKEPIDYSVIRRTSVDLEKGQTEIDTRGAKGEKEVVYTIKRVDGVEVSKSKKSETVTQKPQNEILIVGIGPKLVHSGLYADLLNEAAKKYLINATALQCLMYRESGGSADAGYPDGQYQGLFQYDPGFWSDIGSGSIWDASAQIYATAYALTHGYAGRWPTWGICAGR